MNTARCGALAIATSLAVCASTVRGQAAPGGRIEVVAQAQHVTHALGDWSGLASRLTWRPSARDTWYGEAFYLRAFGDAGAYAGVAERRQLNPAWSTYVSLGGGTGEFVLPDLRADLQVTRAWGVSRRLLTTVGGTLVNAKRGYADVSAMGSLAAYLSGGAVFEVGERVTRSSPGSVRSARTFSALTVGHEGRAFFVLRGSGGTEGYQLLGLSEAHRRFRSGEGAVSWRQWLGRRGGFLLQGEHYRNDLYSRTGVSVGVFRDW